MLKSYKSPIYKLVAFFKKSRDNWKTKYQEVKRRNKRLENKVRVIDESRQKWKDEAILLRRKLRKLTTTTESASSPESKKKELVPSDTKLNEGKIAHHQYSATTIFMMLEFVLAASVSFRGSERVLNIVNDVLENPLTSVPSWFSVRLWLLRLGYYKLMCPKTHADDWCWIADHTIQLGKTKCLLILGIRLSELPQGRSLQYQDLEPIDLIPVESSTGEIVWQQLEETAKKTGSVPRVVVSDYGSDLKKGIEKFCEKHDNCTSIYDIKHKTACLIKTELKDDEDWKAFTKLASQTRNQLQQTALAHLRSPNQRSKARYMNIEILLSWARKSLYIMDNNRNDFTEAEKQQLFKLEWLNDYRGKLEEWGEILQVVTLAEKHVRQTGITLNEYQVLQQRFAEELVGFTYPSSIKLKKDLVDFVKDQGNACQEKEKLLGSSEIIESLFGKQKELEGDHSKEGFTSLILGIGAFAGKTTVDTVKRALTSTPVKDIMKWCKEELGETLQSKKVKAYAGIRNGTKAGSSSCGLE